MIKKTINDELLDDIDLTLEPDEQQYLTENPLAVSLLYKFNVRSISYKYLADIFRAQIAKALGGDTASAKFLAELCEPEDVDTVINPDPVAWETRALALQVRLDYEGSAEELVVKLLQYATTLSDVQLRTILTE